MRSPSKTWKVDELDIVDVNSHIRFITPNNFEIIVEGINGCIELLTSLVLRGAEIRPGDGTRLYVSVDGNLTLVDTDTWVNPTFGYGDDVTNAPALAYVIKMFLLEKLGG